jgi:signal peptidase I
MKTSPYSLRKSRNILQTNYALYKKKGKILTLNEREIIENDLQQLDQAVLAKDRETASIYAKKVNEFGDVHFKKSIFEYASELVIALILALIIATVVRQMWFELYEIPTGSMRPTFKEQDHLTVSKLAFGINVPMMTDHFYFDPKLVQRSSVVIFSGDGIPHIDMNTNYFGVFPYKKRYIKRLIAKPNDSVYFYGGKVYVVDKDGNLDLDLLNSPWMKGLEYIPFLQFEGIVSSGASNQIMFKQMNMPLGKLTVSDSGDISGEVFNGKEWIKDDPLQKSHDGINSYSDFIGIRNYAMARLLTKQQLESSPENEGLPEGELYLELRHNPSLTNPKPIFLREGRGMGVMMKPYKSIISLQQKHLDAIMDHMYTARFVVKDEVAHRYSLEDISSYDKGVRFPKIPDGTYEFYYGVAYKIGFGGIASKLPAEHPLYVHSAENIQRLYNLGVEVSSYYDPQAGNQSRFPQRYTYFKKGDLFLLGAPALKHDDPVLIKFNERELERESKATVKKPYVAFKDHGAPMKSDGTLDVDFIRTYGMKIPEGHYLVLGDNHAMSSDSRVFGVVPEKNLQGAPSLILWPPGDGRLGAPEQKPYPIFNLSRLMIWGIALVIFFTWYMWHRNRLKKPIFKKIDFK